MLDATTIDGVMWAGRAGTGPDVLFLGGPLDDAASLRPLLRALESAHRVTAFDPRGSGLGITPLAPPSVEELVGDALTVLREADVARAHVVGASRGGLVAQRLALDHPDRVESLVLSGSWARSDRFLRGVLREWAMAAERARSVDELRTHLALWTEGRAAWNGLEVDDRLAELEGTGPREIERIRVGLQAALAAAFDPGAADRLTALRVPTLVIGGEEDRVSSPRLARELAELIPGAQLTVLPGAGHHVHHDDPGRFAELLERFWDGEGELAAAAP